MKRKIKAAVTAALAVLMLSGCGQQVKTEANKDAPSMFTIVERSSNWAVVYHNETKVMYAVSGGYYNCGTFTVIVDETGKPMLWEG